MSGLRLPRKRVLRRAMEIAAAKDFRVQINPQGLVQLVTQNGTILNQPEINALAREIELEQEAQGAAA
jgi:hypothetical protein